MLYPIQNAVRNRMDLSGIWDFRTDPEEIGEREGWANGLGAAGPRDIRPIALPGSWNEQYEDLYNYLGLSWYVKRVYVPASWQTQRVFLRVGSANYCATVYINGEKVGMHEGGHLPFAFEIGERVRWGEENVIAISVENHLKPTRVPSGNMDSPLGGFASHPRTTFDFFPFAGIHRPVVLYSVPRVCIEDVTVATEIAGAEGRVKVQVRLNAPGAAEGVVQLGDGSRTWEEHLTFAGGAAQAELRVDGARLWSDTDPFLYDLSVRAGEDHYSLKVGIRTVAVAGGQILLNGKAVKLNGFGRHEDFIASGKGLNLPLMVKDYQLMRWTGANSFRTAHYPYSEEEMQMADREGFLVIDEIPAVSLQFENETNAAERLRVCRQQIEELVARDKNHPAVVMWCVANEPLPANLRFAGGGAKASTADPSEALGKDFLETLIRRARELDPTRPVTLAALAGSPASWLEQVDVVCLNRYFGWYMLGGQLEAALGMLEKELDAIYERWQRPIILTEFGADTMPGMHGHPDVMWTEEYQASLIRGYLEAAARRSYVAGMQVWNFADFAAVQSINRVGGMNMKGVFTRTRQPKMAAHVLREMWARAERD